MVGFIGVLSSFPCILILMFITLLAKYTDSLLLEPALFKSNKSFHRYAIASSCIVNAMQAKGSSGLAISTRAKSTGFLVRLR